MRMIEIDFEAQPPIDGYGANGFRIGGTWHDGAIILLADGAQGFEPPLSEAALSPVLQNADALDVVIFGQGPDIAPLPSGLRRQLEDAGIGVEIMATPPACRTYNVCLTEDRRVGAVLLPVGPDWTA